MQSLLYHSIVPFEQFCSTLQCRSSALKINGAGPPLVLRFFFSPSAASKNPDSYIQYSFIPHLQYILKIINKEVAKGKKWHQERTTAKWGTSIKEVIINQANFHIFYTARALALFVGFCNVPKSEKKKKKIISKIRSK